MRLQEQWGLSQGRRGWPQAHTGARLRRTHRSRSPSLFIWWEHTTVSEVGLNCASRDFLLQGKKHGWGKTSKLHTQSVKLRKREFTVKSLCVCLPRYQEQIYNFVLSLISSFVPYENQDTNYLSLSFEQLLICITFLEWQCITLNVNFCKFL